MRREPDSLTSRAIPGYRITGILGVGGYSTVYRATEEASARPVALKVMAEKFQGNRRIERAMAREIDLLRELCHEGIAKGYGVAPGAPRLTIVLELVPGCTLAAHVAERGGLPCAEAASILFQTGLALSYLHGRGILHLDIKPGNIMVTPLGKAKLIDFSLARPYRRLHRLVPSWLRRAIPGTPVYMAPEQIRGERLDPRTDLYALGVVGYQALTNRLPFAGECASEVLRRQESSRPPAPSRLRPGVSVPLEILVLRLLEESPADRPGSADEVCSALAPLVRQSLRPAGARP